MNILIAEDNLINQKLASKIFEKLGYKADTAFNGIEVLGFLNSKKYDIIFMDVQMPGMDGLECTRSIRNLESSDKPVIIALTGSSEEDDKSTCIAAGMDDFISKPFRQDDIKRMIEKWSSKEKVC